MFAEVVPRIHSSRVGRANRITACRCSVAVAWSAMGALVQLLRTAESVPVETSFGVVLVISI